MFPSFDLFGRTIGMYPLTAICGALVAGAYAMATARKRGHNDNDILVMLLVAAIGVLFGGQILYGMTTGRMAAALLIQSGETSGLSGLWQVLYNLLGGSVFYGGLLGGLLAGCLYVRRKGLPLGEYSDMAAPAIPLFHAFGRVGCFLGGCCYGIPWRHGIVFRHSLVESANHVARFPVQLAESAFNLLLFLLLSRLLRRGRGKGRLLAVYLMLYAAGRFLLEFLRGDPYRGFFLGLSTSQAISILILAVCGVGVATGWRGAPSRE